MARSSRGEETSQTPTQATPFRVVARLFDGRIALNSREICLDGILAWAWMLENHPDVLLTNQAATNKAITPDLSAALCRARWHGADRDDWFWACSWGQYKALGERIEYWHKRFDMAEAERFVDLSPLKPGGRERSGRVVLAGGPYKSWRIPVVTSLVDTITWYGMGYPDEVARLLRYIRHIGKHGRSGWGFVQEWRVEPWPVDLSVVDEEGALMRHVPSPQGTAVLALRPPYWAQQNRRGCLVPYPLEQEAGWYEEMARLEEI